MTLFELARGEGREQKDEEDDCAAACTIGAASAPLLLRGFPTCMHVDLQTRTLPLPLAPTLNTMAPPPPAACPPHPPPPTGQPHTLTLAALSLLLELSLPYHLSPSPLQLLIAAFPLPRDAPNLLRSLKSLSCLSSLPLPRPPSSAYRYPLTGIYSIPCQLCFFLLIVDFCPRGRRRRLLVFGFHDGGGGGGGGNTHGPCATVSPPPCLPTADVTLYPLPPYLPT